MGNHCTILLALLLGAFALAVGLARAVSSSGNDAEAGRLAEQAMGNHDSAGGPASLPQALCLHCLGTIELNQNKLVTAKGHLQRALIIRQQLAPGSLVATSSLNN